MSTDQNVYERLEPLSGHEIRPDFIAAIPRPSGLAKPTRIDRLRQIIEERFFFGEFGVALGAFGALMITGELLGAKLIVLAIVASLGAARLMTALLGKRVRTPGGAAAAGVTATLVAYLLGHLGVFLMTHPSVHALFIPVEWLKVSALLHPLRFTEFLVFGGGLAALVNVAAQRRLVEKPWLCGTLHGEQGRRVWRGLAILLCTFVLVGAVMSPSSDERKSPGQRWYPLSLSLERALERGDVETADRILRFYPQALEWYSYNDRVIDSVNSVEMASYVVRNGRKFDGPAGFDTALQRAVKAQNDPLMEYLLMHGADPNQGQRLPLVTAVKNERLYVIEILLDFGADPGLDDFKGESPMDVAKNSGNRELLNRLRRASR